MNFQQNRPATAPDFLLSRPSQSIRTQGAHTIFPDPFDAATALHDAEVPLVVGAIPFDTSLRAALMTPTDTHFSDGPLEPPAVYRGKRAASSLDISSITPAVSTDDHRTTVMSAIATIHNSALEKVVLARPVDVEFHTAPDPLLIAARLIDLSAYRDGFAVDLSATGREEDRNTMFVGSSPEVLVRRHASTVSAFPLAGSLPRTGNHTIDQESAQALQSSHKNASEHAFVVDHYRSILEPLCASLSIPDYPEIHMTNEMIHLGTKIEGTLKSPDYSALDLALMLHPTPAIAGTPTEAALGIINIAEEPREFYAGAVGWCNTQGDGEYMVAIRSAVIDGNKVRTWAGGGIVADSDADEEVEETTAKMQTVLRALNVPAALRKV